MNFQFFVRSSLQHGRVFRPCLLSALIVCACANTTIAYAAGLGPLKLHSSLGQHLDAEIEVTGVDAEDLKTLSAYMASTEVFEQMGIPIPSVLQHIRFEMDADAVAGARVVLSSVKPIREPFLNLVVELSWAQGTYLREFTFLLDPVLLHRSGNALVSNPSSIAEQVIDSAESGINTDYAATSAEPEMMSEQIVLVRSGDNLLDIARRYKPTQFSIEQVAMAIYDRNPSAFFGSVHKLKRGAELVIPEFNQAQLRTRRSARQLLGITSGKSLAKARDIKSNEIQNPNAAAVVEKPEAEFVENVHEMLDKAVDTSQDAQKAVVAASQSIGSNRRSVDEPSVSALQILIGELRGAMVGLGQELQLKTTQLDDISERVDHLQQQQAVTTTTVPATSASIVGSMSALKATPTATASDSVSAKVPSITKAPIASEREVIPKKVEPVAMVVEPTNKLDRHKAEQTEVQNRSIANIQAELSSGTQASAPAMMETVVDSNRDEPEKATAFSWFFDTDQNKKIADRIRDAGLLSLAFLLGVILVKRLFSTVRLIDVELQERPVNGDSIALDLNTYPAEAGSTSDSISALSTIEYFRAHLTSEQHKEQALKDTLSDHPDRQDVRLELLKVYHERGAVEMFAQSAREMYNVTQGKTPEWHAVIEMGLALDADMSFYSEPEDHGFTYNDEFAVTGTRISSVSGGRSVGQRPSSQQAEDRQASVKMRDNNPQAGLDEVVEAKGAGADTEQAVDEQIEFDGFEINSESTDDLDIDLDDGIDASIDQSLNIGTFDNTSAAMSLDEAALDQVVWKDEGSDGLSDTQMTEHPNFECGADHNDDGANSSTQELISNLENLHELGSEAESDQSSEIEENEVSFSSESEQAGSSWKESEVRLELAVVYIDMGNKDGAWQLLEEVIKDGDASQILVAEGLMAKLR